MSALAPALMILSGSIHAVVNALVKSGRDKMAARALTDASSALVLLPATLLVPLPTGAWGWLGLSAVVHAAYLYALVRAYELSDFSASYPVLRGTAPLVTAIVAVGLLGERASAPDMLGVLAIGASVVALAAGRHLSPGSLAWSAATGVLVAGYTVVDAAGVRAAPGPGSFIVWLFVMMGGVTLALFAAVSRGRVFAGMRDQWRPGIVAGLLSILTYGMALTAFSLGPTAPLAALRETGMVTALLIATLVLKERVTPARAVAVIGVMAGAVLILAA